MRTEILVHVVEVKFHSNQIIRKLSKKDITPFGFRYRCGYNIDIID